MYSTLILENYILNIKVITQVRMPNQRIPEWRMLTDFL